MGTESVRCFYCRLVQFTNEKFLCRRCKQPYYGAVAPKIEAPVQLTPLPSEAEAMMRKIAVRVRELRLKKKWSQRKLAEIFGCPRTYISKIENVNVLPYLTQLTRFSEAFGISMEAFLLDSDDASELLKDPFLAEMASLGVTLRPEQRAAVLVIAAKMSQRKVEVSA
jgi:transcriptional regulator with XRE-family HTH domain